MSALIGGEWPGPTLNVLNRRMASAEEQSAGRNCVECCRSSWAFPYWKGARGVLRCILQDCQASPQKICDAFDPGGALSRRPDPAPAKPAVRAASNS